MGLDRMIVRPARGAWEENVAEIPIMRDGQEIGKKPLLEVAIGAIEDGIIARLAATIAQATAQAVVRGVLEIVVPAIEERVAMRVLDLLNDRQKLAQSRRRKR